MILNDVMAVIFRYFTEFAVAFGGLCVKVADPAKLSATEM